MEIIDTHSHIDGPEFSEDINEVLDRAKAEGVSKILIPAINCEGLTHALELCNRFPDTLYPMIGLHPEEVKEDYLDQLNRMYQLLQSMSERFCAIGEVGLDFYWDETFKDQQIDAFMQQIEWAKEFQLPLMIHARNAHRELVDIMEQKDCHQMNGVFHCFTGTEEEAKELLAFEGFKLGIGGVLTFKKSTLPKVLKKVVPIDRIVVETDSPYLAPVPHRGKRNESAFIIETIKRLSSVYECKIENIAIQTTKNAYFLLR